MENNQHRTSNELSPAKIGCWMFGVGCWMLKNESDKRGCGVDGVKL
jgi:hypothetical protein